MSDYDRFEDYRVERPWSLGGAGMGALRVTLLFGSAAVALALILTPIVESQTRPRVAQSAYPSGLDFITTGSVPRGTGSTYTIRRSVLQPSPSSVCIIRGNGIRSGDC